MRGGLGDPHSISAPQCWVTTGGMPAPLAISIATTKPPMSKPAPSLGTRIFHLKGGHFHPPGLLEPRPPSASVAVLGAKESLNLPN